jgi:hypothetical protein
LQGEKVRRLPYRVPLEEDRALVALWRCRHNHISTVALVSRETIPTAPQIRIASGLGGSLDHTALRDSTTKQTIITALAATSTASLFECGLPCIHSNTIG